MATAPPERASRHALPHHRTHSSLFHRNHPQYTVPAVLRLPLSPESLQELALHAPAREALDLLAARLESNDLFEISCGEFARIVTQTSKYSGTFKPTHEYSTTEALMVPPAMLLLPFPSLLADFLWASSPTATPSMLHAPVKLKSRGPNQPEIRISEGEPTPFVLALWGGHLSSARLVASLGARIELPSLASYIVNCPWTALVSEIVSEFVKRAEAEPSLWKSTDEEGASFLGMLARAERKQQLVLDSKSVACLHDLLDQFLSHEARFANLVDKDGRDPLVYAIHKGYKFLFDWVVKNSERKVGFSAKTATRLMTNGGQEVFGWVWKDGTRIGDMKLRLNPREAADAKHPMTVAELALSSGLDASAIVLVEGRFEHRPEFVRDRILLLKKQLNHEQLTPGIAELIRCLAKHAQYKVVLQEVIPELPLLLHSRYRVPFERWSYLLEDEATAFRVDSIARDPTRGNVNLGTLLHWAVRERDLAFVKLLLSYQIDVSVPDWGGDTALHLAVALFEPESRPSAASNERQILQALLLGRNALSAILHPDANGLTPIKIAYLKMIVAGPQQPQKDALLDELLTSYQRLSGYKAPRINYWKDESGGKGGSVLHDLARLFIKIADMGICYPAEILLRLEHISPVFSAFSEMAYHDCAEIKASGSSAVGLLSEWDVNTVNADGFTALDLLLGVVREFKAKNRVDVAERLEACSNLLMSEMGMRASPAAVEGSAGPSVVPPRNGNIVIKSKDPRLKRPLAASLDVPSIAAQIKLDLVSKPPPTLPRPSAISEPRPPPSATSENLLSQTPVLSGRPRAAEIPAVKSFETIFTELKRFAYGCDFVKAKESLESQPGETRRKLLLWQSDQGNLLLHLLAHTPKFRRNPSTSESAALSSIVNLLSDSLTSDELNIRNKNSLTPLAISIFEDANGSATPPPSPPISPSAPCKSKLTEQLAQRGCTVTGTGADGRTVIHGVITTYLHYCSAQQKVNLQLDAAPSKKLRVVRIDAVCATIFAFTLANVDINAEDRNGHTALDQLCAEAGPAFFRDGYSVGGAVEWSNPANAGLKLEQEKLVGSLRALGARRAFDVMLERAREAGRLVKDKSADVDMDGGSEAGDSEFSDVVPAEGDMPVAVRPAPVIQSPPASVERNSAFVPPRTLPHLFRGVIRMCDAPKIIAQVSRLSEPARTRLMKSADTTGNLPIHHFACTANRFRRPVFSSPQTDVDLCRNLIAMLSYPVGRDAQLRNLFNDVGLTPLAQCVVTDSVAPQPLFSSPTSPLSQSLLTVSLQDFGYALAGINREGRNVIHGAVRFWLELCEFENGKDYRPEILTEAKALKLDPERLSAVIASFVYGGVDINLQDRNGHTPLDLLMAMAGPSFLASSDPFKKDIDWNCPSNRVLRDYRIRLCAFMREMGAMRGLDVDLKRQREGGERWSSGKRGTFEHSAGNVAKKVRGF
ncbi:hypothetical protein HDU98_001965 [Podochytrium sp. JEL0797]|nr:hypothetical protein HDU98_001965 [Podochytrium sp. JEL0797]